MPFPFDVRSPARQPRRAHVDETILTPTGHSCHKRGRNVGLERVVDSLGGYDRVRVW